MVVDAAVVGLARDGSVGDGHHRRAQPGGLGVTGQQRGAQRRTVLQAAALVEPQQRLGSAVHPGHGVGVGEIRAAGGAVDPVDLHRRVPQPQPAVADESLQRARPNRVAELGHLLQAR